LQNDTVERIGILPAHPQNVRRMHAPPLLTSSPRASASAPCPAATCPHHPSNHQSPQTRAPKPLDSGHANARPRCPATGVALRALDCLPQSGGVSLSKAGGRGGQPHRSIATIGFCFPFLMIISASFGHDNCRQTCIHSTKMSMSSSLLSHTKVGVFFF
jgi:hypothetical protein